MSTEPTSDRNLADREAITATIEAYGKHLSASDVAAIVDLYTADTVVMQPDQPTVVGTEALAATYRAAFAAIRIECAFTIEQILVDGDLASARTLGDGAITMLDSGAVAPGQFRELFVLSRTDGSWKIAQYMFQQLPAA